MHVYIYIVYIYIIFNNGYASIQPHQISSVASYHPFQPAPAQRGTFSENDAQ